VFTTSRRRFNDANGVVNPDGTVKGISALRVADASIMPSDCRATPQFTTAVIGEAIARMMMQKMNVSNNAAAMALQDIALQDIAL
jgi:choline dehydrogenase